MNIGYVTRCQMCDSTALTRFFDLGHQPIVQKYLTSDDRHEPEDTYPLGLLQCNTCHLVQLDYIIDPRAVFPPAYPYRTGLTNMLLRNFEELADAAISEKLCAPGDTIVDIGSNDGSLLSSFKKRGMHVIGVEPTNAAKVARKNGVPTYQEFFGVATAKKIRSQHGAARIVTATNVFAHIPDPPAILHAVKMLMDEESVFISESQYLRDIVEKLEFDTIYHEHLRYYALYPLMTVAKKAGLSVIDAYRISSAGGSIRVTMKKGTHSLSARGKKVLADEKKTGLNTIKTLRLFAERSFKAKHDLMAILTNIRQNGKTIAAISSPGRSNTLLNFVKITPDIVEYAGEKKGSPKIGLYTPGTHIPVVDEKRLFEKKPEYALILSWHIGDELMKLYRKLGYKGKFIMPLPKPRIISK